MSELPVDEKDAPEGYYAAGDVGRGCMSCAFISSNAHCPRNVDGTYLCSSTGRKDNQSVYFIKKPESTKQSIVAGRKLYVYSEGGHVVLAFEGELSFLPRIIIPNYVDAPAKDIAQHMMVLWNENANKIETGELMTVDPNEAPEGYVAVEYESGGCRKCSFYEVGGFCERHDCCSYGRHDHSSVYFVEKPESTKQDTVPTIHLNISLRDFFAGGAITGILVDTALKSGLRNKARKGRRI